MIIQNNQFTQYQLNSEELLVACYLSPEQRAILQNDMAECAIKRAAIVHDLSNPGKSLLEDAALKGQITYIQYLLSRHESVSNLENTDSESPEL